MSRVEKFGKSRQKHSQHEQAPGQTAASTDSMTDHALPPRSKKHPSSSQKLSKWYYNLLFVLFVCLVAGLFWYGINYTE
ncbi:hypothetical protein [Paenibacillus protaetiae]|uniref:Uncharacterized protein n=1 Tax=Paenibacillus protaetiae TaxID=2509456 RepID=A0A4P6EWS5_9BACL|nr:hypothetical protein [Paenibacillus protaetiae]QAY66189.1 hypothetical protein ET464_07045 [Paenibacillus protaetiae]